ncbi:hypothetical protein BDB00DRAFT_851998 [Zychaea mexicana]|uniref:uncharacterized protein n=1 Tax=Zychaea mexicana TaxID=64656 RepID=UPI0022FE92E5|nr:uncharacterized protein BDB00DRAFT_851998 [Zychaea mexicana]KAI9484995.1 hypothetical protein BDB00DRAFT_851998 [Zychaea mexicana]
MDTTTFQPNTRNHSGPIIPYTEAQSSVAMDVDQDSSDFIKPEQLGPDADPKVVCTYLEQQSLVTCPDQQIIMKTKRFQLIPYENWKERLNTMKALSDKTLDDTKVAHLVPKNLPFLDDFVYVLEAHSINVEKHWKRLMPLTCDATRRAWLVKTMQRHDMNWTKFRVEFSRAFSSLYQFPSTLDAVIQAVLTLAEGEPATCSD